MKLMREGREGIKNRPLNTRMDFYSQSLREEKRDEWLWKLEPSGRERMCGWIFPLGSQFFLG